jgi:hypothetical protein
MIIIVFINYLILLLWHHPIDKCNSFIMVGKYHKLYTGISIITHNPVCLEVNTHTGTLDYFMNDKHIKDGVVNVPKMYILEFHILFFICFYLLI